MNATRLAQLKEFVEGVKALNIENDDQFRQFVVDSLEVLEMGDREFADSLSVSRPCVNRWSNGRNLPRTATRKATVASVMQKVDLRIKALHQAVIRANTAETVPAYAYPIAAKGQ
jgi:hypothetical protein